MVWHDWLSFNYLPWQARASIPLQWRHNGRDGVSNYQPHHCLLYRLFSRRSKKASNLRVTSLCVGNSPVTGEFPAQRASNAENVSIWWRHHVLQKHFREREFYISYKCFWSSFKLTKINFTSGNAQCASSVKPFSDPIQFMDTFMSHPTKTSVCLYPSLFDNLGVEKISLPEVKLIFRWSNVSNKYTITLTKLKEYTYMHALPKFSDIRLNIPSDGIANCQITYSINLTKQFVSIMSSYNDRKGFWLIKGRHFT